MHMISTQLYHRWNPTVEKSQSNATNVILSPFRLHLFGSKVWEHISKHTLEKSQANAANHQWGFVSSNTSILKRHLRKHAVGKNTNKCNQCQYAFSQPSDLRRHLKTHWRKVKQMPAVGLFSSYQYQHYQAFPQIACIKGYIITLATFFRNACNQMSPQISDEWIWLINGQHERMQIHTSCICATFLRCVFSNVFSNRLA